jgi:hypothetical protein
LSESTDLKIISARKTVTAAGTKEVIRTGSLGEVRVRAFRMRALTNNTGNVYFGAGDVSSTVGDVLAPGEVWDISVSDEEWKHGLAINLSKLWLDVDVSGEGVSYTLVRD